MKILSLLLILIVLGSGCSTLKKDPAPSKKKTTMPSLGNFDRAFVPNEEKVINRMISIVQPELPVELREKYSKDIYYAVQKHKINPQIIVALIDTESNFNAKMISTTGDLSIAQLNVEVWNKEFKRMKLPEINLGLLTVEDQGYAVDTMAMILNILKKRYEKNDRRWYARYHSNTKKYKWNYLRKIEVRMKMLDSSHQEILAAK